ncbi:MAG: pectinesterase family protein [Prevotella pectinovora]|uniref:pectinesterase family protein n=1 Tax=Prevotella TaxID=838 RepID=UPI00033A6F63|nr:MULTISPECIES: pectinesterase family protein [Prevotella]KIP56548.1 pectin esterase [Prevotella pectinovora]MCI6047279.1 pectinesterase family protein [Prevotella pectinovora]MDD7744106.1 pectinesterase family protein [Prevotella pectinovora]MDY4778549.1 pectinesterase family protein [Prevotella pectinovora]CDD05269.1 pectinesterase domain protein [Prevotella sp. CAG:592]
MRKLLLSLVLVLAGTLAVNAANKYDNPDTLFVARDGTAEFRNIDDAIEVCRAFMEYHKVIFVKKGTYKEKLIVPSWLTNIEICGEDRDNTIITYDDHANVFIPGTDRKMGTFRTYTVRVDGNDITFRNITIENNAARLGQAVALHTQGDRLTFVNCRILGNQDTVYTGGINTRLYFKDCHIEGTTDFIFGPSTAWFENCTILSRTDSYITAASTPQNVEYGYVFNRCKIVAAEGVSKVYLGRPWRPYAHTLFMNCQLGKHILPVGWHNWSNTQNETTARYCEYNNHGEGAATKERAAWTRQLTRKEAAKVTLENVFRQNGGWIPNV